jgi:hypothetical protein
MPRIYKRKLGNPQGVQEWHALENTGDVKRLLAWCVHSVRNQTLDVRTAATLGQLACYLLRAIEGSDMEARLAVLEKEILNSDAPLED